MLIQWIFSLTNWAKSWDLTIISFHMRRSLRNSVQAFRGFFHRRYLIMKFNISFQTKWRFSLYSSIVISYVSQILLLTVQICFKFLNLKKVGPLYSYFSSQTYIWWKYYLTKLGIIILNETMNKYLALLLLFWYLNFYRNR